MKGNQIKCIAQRAAIEATKREKQKIKEQIVMQMYACMLTTLYDKWNWNPEQLVTILDQMTNQFDCIADKYVKIEDFYKLLEEMGINVK